MLSLNRRSKKAFQSIIALLFFISCITFHSFASAEVKDKIAEEYRALGYEEQQKGNLNEALSYYTKATSLGLENATLLNDMGVLYEEIDLYGRAEKFYLRAIQSDRDYLPPYNNLAYLYQRLGKPDKAARYFKLRFELGNSMDPWAQKAKDELMKIDPRYREWAMAFEAEALNKQVELRSRREFYQNVKRGQEHYRRGNDLFKDEKYKEAIKEYDHALHLSPKNPKIIDARKQAILEMSKKNIEEQSENAIKRLEAGDTLSARHEIQQMLTTIPNEPILVSPQYAR
ncbi:MAG: tetratricopeptide repeat protein [Candidatus Omnitrophica bacterium]|nr:tetratricopeptide repeat protein [Candidatus Omnitrophota bacterium]